MLSFYLYLHSSFKLFLCLQVLLGVIKSIFPPLLFIYLSVPLFRLESKGLA